MIITITVFLTLTMLNGINAATFAENNSTSDIQNFIDTQNDNELILSGQFTNLSHINITKSMKIRGINNAVIDGSGLTNNAILFNITETNVFIENLIIIGYKQAIESNTGGLTIQYNTIKTNGIAILISGSSVSNNKINNNIIETNANDAYGIFIRSPNSIFNNNIYENDITVIKDLGDNIAIHSTNGDLYNNNVYKNNLKVSVMSIGIYLRTNYGTLRDNKVFENNINGNAFYSSGICIEIRENGNLINNEIYGNTILIDTTYAFGISMGILKYGNFSNNSIYNNSINMTSSVASKNNGIELAYGDGFIGTSIHIFGNNIFVKNGNAIASTMGYGFSGLDISYNRIFAGKYFILIDRLGTDNKAYANWFWNNTPDSNKFTNVLVESYYVVNAVAIKNNVGVGESWTIDYTFYLNGTTNIGEYWKLPYFIAILLNDYDEEIDNRIAYSLGIWSIPVKNIRFEDFTLILDYEIIPLGFFQSEKGKTDITIEIIGNSSINETVIIKGVLTNGAGNVLANKEINIYINGELVETMTTDSNGVISFEYTFKNIGAYQFQFIFKGDEDYYGCESNVLNAIISIKETPDLEEKNQDPEEKTNKTKKKSTKQRPIKQPKQSKQSKMNKDYNDYNINKGSASLKQTGTPLIAIFLILLANLGLFIRRK